MTSLIESVPLTGESANVFQQEPGIVWFALQYLQHVVLLHVIKGMCVCALLGVKYVC